MKFPVCPNCGCEIQILSVEEATEYHDASRNSKYAVNPNGVIERVDESVDGSWYTVHLSLKCVECEHITRLYAGDGPVEPEYQELVEELFDVPSPLVKRA